MSRRTPDLEGAVMEAAIFSEIIAQWMASCVGFEKAEPPKLSAEQCTQIYFAMNQIAHMTRKADEAYHNPRMKEIANV